MNKKMLLGAGLAAAPLYFTVSLAQALTRDGFDLSRHAWSLLSNGDFGWIQITNFVVCGLMVIAGAVGLGRGWGPRLIGVYGASLIAAGAFLADPEGVTEVSWHGMLHFMAGAIGFGSLIVACLIYGRCFARKGDRRMAWFSRIAGIVFLAGFAGIASATLTAPFFIAALAIVSAWLSVLFAREMGV